MSRNVSSESLALVSYSITKRTKTESNNDIIGLPMKTGETGSDIQDFPLAWPPFPLGPSSPLRGLEVLEKRTVQLDYLTKPCGLSRQGLVH